MFHDCNIVKNNSFCLIAYLSKQRGGGGVWSLNNLLVYRSDSYNNLSSVQNCKQERARTKESNVSSRGVSNSRVSTVGRAGLSTITAIYPHEGPVILAWTPGYHDPGKVQGLESPWVRSAAVWSASTRIPVRPDIFQTATMCFHPTAYTCSGM